MGAASYLSWWPCYSEEAENGSSGRRGLAMNVARSLTQGRSDVMIVRIIIMTSS